MSGPLLTPADLGELLNGLDAETTEKLRLRNHWPHVRLSRQPFVVRYTPEQADEIVRRHTVPAESGPPTPVRVPGQTKRSAARRRSA